MDATFFDGIPDRIAASGPFSGGASLGVAPAALPQLMQ
jgi:hypothetical protein